MEDATCCPVLELRQYLMKPGGRDALTDLFEAALLRGQQEQGMTVIGPFEDHDRSSRFVWLRGFPDMASRARSLAAFYGGPVWAEHKHAANETMIDSDDVLLLRPARAGSGFRTTPAAASHPSNVVTFTICHLDRSREGDVVDVFERDLAPALRGSGADVLAYFVSETSENDFPALPVREGEHVFVWFLGFSDALAYGRHSREIAGSYPALVETLRAASGKAALETRVLSPTALCPRLLPLEA